MDLFEKVSEDIKTAMKCKEIFLGSENRSGSQ